MTRVSPGYVAATMPQTINRTPMTMSVQSHFFWYVAMTAPFSREARFASVGPAYALRCLNQT